MAMKDKMVKLDLNYVHITLEKLSEMLNFPNPTIKVASIYVDLSSNTPILKIGIYDPENAMKGRDIFYNGMWMSDDQYKTTNRNENIDDENLTEIFERLSDERFSEDPVTEAMRERKAL